MGFYRVCITLYSARGVKGQTQETGARGAQIAGGGRKQKVGSLNGPTPAEIL